MKNTIKFPLFGDDNDYLCFDLEKLMRLQRLTERKTLAAIIEPLANGDFSLEYIIGGIKIGLEDCYRKTGKDINKVQEQIEESFAREDISITNYVNLLATAINATGMFKSGPKVKNPPVSEK